MRIAFLVDRFPAISETFILQQITGLIERGHDVDIFSNNRGAVVDVHPEVRKYKLLEHAYFPEAPASKLKRISTMFRIIFTNRQVRFTQWLACLNVFMYGLRALNLRLFYDAVRFLDKEPYDIIHCQLEPLGLQGMLFRNMGFLKGRLVTSWRGHDFPTYVRNFKNCGYSNLYQQGDMFLPVSESLKRQLMADGCDEAKIRVLRSGINLDNFHFIPRTLPVDGEISILSIGRLVENKGIKYGIRAVEKLVKTNPRVRYRVVGDGPLMKDLQKLVEELELDHCVSLLGWKSRAGVIQELQYAALLVTPSITAPDGSQEGIPNVLKEAMAMGVPVIGTEHSGIPEIITDGKTGFLVPERDVKELASKIDYLLSHPAIWEELGHAARAHIESCYNIEQLNNDLIRIYEGIL